MDSVLFVIPALAMLAPLLARALSRWIRIPIVVFELLLGIIVGPSLLGWAEPSAFMGTLAALGLAMLFFIAGSEIDFGVFRERTGRRAGFGWVLSLVMGLCVGVLIAPGDGLGDDLGLQVQPGQRADTTDNADDRRLRSCVLGRVWR